MQRDERNARGLLAFFADPARAAQAVEAIRKRGVAEVRVQSPALYPEIEAALRRRRSRLGWITFAGALTGAALGLALTIYTSLDLPLMVGGKPIVSLPAYLVIVFESAVLVGGITNFSAVIVGAAFARRARPVPYDVSATVDRIGVFTAGDTSDETESLLKSLGAEEVRR